jgi:hypothetical protein
MGTVEAVDSLIANEDLVAPLDRWLANSLLTVPLETKVQS